MSTNSLAYLRTNSPTQLVLTHPRTYSYGRACTSIPMIPIPGGPRVHATGKRNLSNVRCVFVRRSYAVGSSRCRVVSCKLSTTVVVRPCEQEEVGGLVAVRSKGQVVIRFMRVAHQPKQKHALISAVKVRAQPRWRLSPALIRLARGHVATSTRDTCDCRLARIGLQTGPLGH